MIPSGVEYMIRWRGHVEYVIPYIAIMNMNVITIQTSNATLKTILMSRGVDPLFSSASSPLKIDILSCRTSLAPSNTASLGVEIFQERHPPQSFIVIDYFTSIIILFKSALIQQVACCSQEQDW